MAKKQTRAERWNIALNMVRERLAAVEGATRQLEDAISGVEDLQAEFSDWRDNMPESLANSPTGEKLEEIVSMDLPTADDIDAAISEVESALENLENCEVPRGFGRD